MDDNEHHYPADDTVLQSSSSPFDHNASFIPLSFPIDHNLFPLFCSGNMADTALNQPPPTVPAGYYDLAKAMDYRVRHIDVKTAELLRADALTYIEKLVVGKPTTKRPRQMLSNEVRMKLQDAIPQKHYEDAAQLDTVTLGGDWLCEDNVLARTAAKYIIFLKSYKHRDERNIEKLGETSGGSKGVALRFESTCVSEDGTVVGRALEKIEAWCNHILASETADDDWSKFEEWYDATSA